MIKKFSQFAELSTSAARASLTGDKQLRDKFNRIHDYLRISLTERCNLRCKYCMPEQGIELTKAEHCLSLPEIMRLSRIFIELCGVKKVRLTGGEPTIDRKLIPTLMHLNEMRNYGLQTVALTTNGLTLKRSSSTYKELGVNMVNISLDTLKPERFELITRRKGMKLVHAGLMSAIEAGFDKVKLNCVVIKGFNDDELVDFAQMTRSHPIEVRFIEFMPFFGNKWAPESLVSFKEMFDKLLVEFPNLERVSQGANETSTLYREPGAVGTIGFITSMTNNFCSGCNRVRLTADGNLKVCLFGRAETSLRDLVRNGATDLEIVQAIKLALSKKSKLHAGAANLQRDVSRPMIKIAQSRMLHSSSSNSDGFSHLDSAGRARMVNVGAKASVKRRAIARGYISVGKMVIEKILDNSMAKGDIMTVSKIAGIMGAKLTSHLIPMCHQIPLDHVKVDIKPGKDDDGVLVVEAEVESEHKTGVEMECLTAVSITLLTIYDMCKSVNKNMIISNITLVHKSKSNASESDQH